MRCLSSRYTPEYQKEINRLKYGKQEEEKETEEVKETEEDKALRFAKEIEMEAKGEEMEVEEEKENKEKENKEEEEENKEEEEEELHVSEEKERQMAMMSRHKRHLFEMIEKDVNKKEKRIASLKKKAKMVNGGLQKKENSV